MTCKHCGKPIAWIERGDAVGWYHTTDRVNRVLQSCYQREPLPVAEPQS